MVFSSLTPGVRSVISGFIIQNLNGVLYLWGGISLYVTSYLRDYDPELTVHDLAILLPIGLLIQTCGYPLCHLITFKFGVKTVLCISWTCYWLAPLLGSFATSFYAFIIGYNVILSVGISMSFMAASLSAWTYYPEKKGTVTGIMLSGFGTGPFFCNFIAFSVVNPDNDTPDLEYGGENYFGPEIAGRVPTMLRVLSAVFFVVGLIGVLILKVPDELKGEKTKEDSTAENAIENAQTGSQEQPLLSSEEVSAENDPNCRSLKEAFRTIPFWSLIMTGLLTLVLPFFIIDVYKSLGTEQEYDDQFVTLIGSFGVFSNGSSRLIWGRLLDKSGFVMTFYFICALQTMMGLVLIFWADIKVLYAIAIIFGCACDGGLFTLFTAEIGRVFGTHLSIFLYTFVLMGGTVGTLFGLILNKYENETIGYGGMFTIFIMMTLVSAILIGAFYNPEVNFVKIRKELKEKEKNKIASQ